MMVQDYWTGLNAKRLDGSISELVLSPRKKMAGNEKNQTMGANEAEMS